MKKIIFIVVLLIAALNAQTTYYLSVSGDDSNDGLSLSTPFETFDEASDNLVAGDILICDGGGGEYTLTNSDTIRFTGTSSDWIKIYGINNFTITFTAVSTKNLIIEGDYVEFNNIKFYGDGTKILYLGLPNNVAGFPKYFRIVNCKFNYSSIWYFNTSRIGDLVVRGCVFRKGGVSYGSNNYENLYGSNVVIEYCTFYDNTFMLYNSSSGGKGFASFKYNIVELVTNIFDFAGSATGIMAGLDNNHNYNIYYNYTKLVNDASAGTITLQTTEKVIDPKLTNPTIMNFYPESDSPARFFAPGFVTIGAEEIISFSTEGR